MKPIIPRRYAPLSYGILQAGITSAVATTVGVWQAPALSSGVIATWLTTWGLSWLAMLPVVVLVSPLLQRAVNALVDTRP